MVLEKLLYKSTARAWIWSDLMDHDSSRFLAVTLTMKKSYDRKYNDEAESSANMRHFLNRLNQRVFGNAYRKHGKRLISIPVREVDTEYRPHYHLILERSPQHLTHANYCDLIEGCWKSTRYGYKQIDIKPVTNSGWVSYITKLKGMSDEVDWENVYR